MGATRIDRSMIRNGRAVHVAAGSSKPPASSVHVDGIVRALESIYSYISI